MQIVSLSGGFTDHSKQSATAFRLMLQAMARPGQIYRISGVLPPQGAIAAGVLPNSSATSP